MKKHWTIRDPKGNIWMNTWWTSSHGANGAWEFLKYAEDRKIKDLKAEGYRVVRCLVEVKP